MTVITLLVLTASCGCGHSKDRWVDSEKETVSQRVSPSAQTTIASGQQSIGANDSSVELVIAPRLGVGLLRFGMTRSEMEALLGKPERSQEKASEYMSKGMAVIGTRETDVAILMFGGWCEKDEPMVQACKYHTNKGIGMGSSEESIAAAYGSPSSKHIVRQASKQFMVLTFDQIDAEFALREGRIVHMTFKSPALARSIR